MVLNHTRNSFFHYQNRVNDFFFFFVRSTLLTHTHTNLQVQRLQKWQAIKNVKTVVLIRLLGPRNDVLMLGKLIILGVS